MSRICFCGMLCLLVSTAGAAPDPAARNGLPGSFLNEMLGEGASLDALGPLWVQTTPRSFNEQMDEARSAFWKQFPDGAAFKRAGGEFQTMLMVKDLQILRQMIARDMTMKLVRQAPSAFNAVIADDGPLDDYDGGIPQIAAAEHRAWSNAVLANLKYDPTRHSFEERAQALPEALKKAAPKLDVYADARTYAEFHRAGRAGAYFPSGAAFVHFALRIQSESTLMPPPTAAEAKARYGKLVEVYGADAVNAAGEVLRRSDLTAALVPRNYEELGIPRAQARPTQAVVFLLNREADARGFAIGVLRTRRFGPDAFDDGRLRYDAMVAAHGASKVHGAVAQVRKLPLDTKTGRIAQGPHAGATRQQALMVMLPLESDPGESALAARIARRKAEYEAIKEAERQKALAAQRERDRKLYARGREVSPIQYANVREAYELAQKIDARTQGYTDLAGDVLKIAGYWNLYAKDAELEPAGRSAHLAAQRLARRKPEAEGDRFAELLGFTAHHHERYGKYLVPLEDVQARWIEEGKIGAGAALDLSMTPGRAGLEGRVALAQEQVQNIAHALEKSRAAREDPVKRRELAMAKRWLEIQEQKLAAYMEAGPGSLETDEDAGPTPALQLENLRLIRELAAGYDPIWLAEVNRHRAAAGLDPVTEDALVSVFAEAAAGMWNAYLVTRDEAHLGPMSRALSIVRHEDKAGGRIYHELVEPLRLPRTLEELPPPPAPVQGVMMATGKLSPTEALDFRTTPAVFELLVKLYDQHNDFARRIAGKSFGPGDEGEANKKAAAEAFYAEMDATIEQIAALDRKLGRAPRLTTYASRVDPNAAVASADPKADAPERPARPEREMTEDPRRPRAVAGDPVDAAGDRGPAELDGFLAALKAAAEADAALLKAINAERAEFDLEPIEAHAECRDWVQIAAGFWDRYARTGEADNFNQARRALSNASRADPRRGSVIEDAVPFATGSRSKVEDQPRTPLGEVQARRVADGSLAESEPLSLIASDERVGLLHDLHEAREDLLGREVIVGRTMKRHDNLRESAVARFEEQLSERRAELAAAEKALAEYDAGYEPPAGGSGEDEGAGTEAPSRGR